jgi:hypothetical protein
VIIRREFLEAATPVQRTRPVIDAKLATFSAYVAGHYQHLERHLP